MRLRPLLCQSSVLLSELRGYVWLNSFQVSTIMPRKSSADIDFQAPGDAQFDPVCHDWGGRVRESEPFDLEHGRCPYRVQTTIL